MATLFTRACCLKEAVEESCRLKLFDGAYAARVSVVLPSPTVSDNKTATQRLDADINGRFDMVMLYKGSRHVLQACEDFVAF